MSRKSKNCPEDGSLMAVAQADVNAIAVLVPPHPWVYSDPQIFVAATTTFLPLPVIAPVYTETGTFSAIFGHSATSDVASVVLLPGTYQGALTTGTAIEAVVLTTAPGFVAPEFVPLVSETSSSFPYDAVVVGVNVPRTGRMTIALDGSLSLTLPVTGLATTIELVDTTIFYSIKQNVAAP